MWIKALIVSGGLILVATGTYVIHWLLNVQACVDIYIHRTCPDLLAKRNPKTGKRGGSQESCQALSGSS